MATDFSIVSYNLHGFGSGLGMLPSLCKLHTVIAVQEHWLSDDGLTKLSDFDTNCRSYEVSAMTGALSTGYLTGRPYGGVGLTWHKSLGNRVSILGSDSSKRCIAIKVNISDSLAVVIVNVYLPCFSSSAEYTAELGSCLGYIYTLYNHYCGCEFVICGDMNFPCDNNNAGFVQANKTLTSLSIICCDDLIVGDKSTYINDSLGHRSSLDHFFVSRKIKRDLVSLQILHSGANLSDHLPVVAKFKWSVTRLECGNGKNNNSFRLRWDKCNLSDYYSVVYDTLNQIVIPSCCFGASGYDSVSEIYTNINMYYQNIVNILLIHYCLLSSRLFRASLTLLLKTTGQMSLTVLRKSQSSGIKYGKVLAVLKVFYLKLKLRLN